ncbi:uncharacterized protein EI90DRAFT_1884430 [Cantharellus anzutake]|uniref:uncharacterized protein n=1 Tax=Cantharellus anzutake TaxID=1750568 RepID=UPI0019085349|nr:uncharacterized protein EI90DRAFT_1884430 [Cantharellus anzutake]KAF8326877.1 hypothetical protein EI90DRAFT_1884430 [Cantharellus anzutake]
MSIPLVPITPRRAVDDFTTPESREASDEEPYGGEEEGRYFSDAERRLAFNPNHASALRSRLFANTGQNLDNPDELHSPLKHTIYDLMEDPTSSTAAFVVHVFTTSLIVLSAVITVLETLPPFHSTPSLVWFGLETALVVCFTVEYLCRAFAHSETQSSLWKWMTSFFSVIDLLAILPYYIEIALQADTNEFFRFSILRTSRLLRVFRPFRYSNTILLTIEVMYLSMKRSKDALLALGFFVLMVLIVFSTLLYFAERGSWDASLDTFVDSDGNPTQFESIPGAAWFVLVTITTVGFGEIIPRTILGRFFTIPLLLFGLLLIALPSFVLGRQFSAVWEAMAARGAG